MNKLKSLFMTVLAVLAMVLPTPFASAQEVNTNAGGTGTITIRNASQSQKYTIYKLFDATVTEDGSGISYKLPSGKTAQNFGGETWFDVDSKGNVTAKAGANVFSEAFATWAKSFGTEVKSAIATDNTLVFTNLTFGYYFVTSSLGAVLTVDSTTPNATVIDKNTTNPTIPDLNNGGGKKILAADGKTTTSTTTAKIGDTVPFQFKFNATNFVTADGVTKQIKSYTITDTPTALTIIQDSVAVKVGTETLVKDKDYTVSFDDTGKMTVVLSWIKEDKSTIYNSPIEVNVTYSAVVTKDAKEGQATNTATLGYNSFNPTDPTDPNHPDNPNPDTPDTPVVPNTPEDNKTTVTTHRFTLKKTNEANDTLTGAEFKLYDAVNNGTEIKVVKESDGVYRVAQADEQGVAIEAGEVVIKGLKHSTTYYLEEMKAPNGYNILTERQAIEVTKDNAAKANIVNKKGGVLPSTGAIGTTLFYLVGSILLLVALVYTISKRRMNNI
ncbi:MULTISPECIES: SpaH/EbpB family LPXTG-anchored major pilin [Streptococcus]|uniref:LPXTG-motif cell wall anchor domain-containing protein n=1 Tax=Streptococcus suis TaxID=1307 RepID=A0A0Z8LFI6_STRSU|nr:SpaH/EbpB family LPXTG-anchored major pilin [Streptococcus suis]MCL4922108.1 SpaH/EbpB family LPXTG-anchored major pilin [Streptococcus suis]NQG75901.1 SpaH/EbpB family LPXTG-anchored major pilin [Streptococcus suis]NQG79651.1 SpaH/EbpB family LPXTG-anchored major pilin [Streptococcus suis]CYV89603.1 LPXTG-motif cell wall anchor domain-containing protein [Streptococcus suis]CYV94252.1 LPXTG-motif cell wall anchor domain-containing protein [Streptococcus suis]